MVNSRNIVVFGSNIPEPRKFCIKKIKIQCPLPFERLRNTQPVTYPSGVYKRGNHRCFTSIYKTHLVSPSIPAYFECDNWSDTARLPDAKIRSEDHTTELQSAGHPV